MEKKSKGDNILKGILASWQLLQLVRIMNTVRFYMYYCSLFQVHMI